MWWSKPLVALALTLAVGACGFTPVFAPGQLASALSDEVYLPEADGRDAYMFNRRFEERLGRGKRFGLDVTLAFEDEALGITSTGQTTRFRRVGRAEYRLTDRATGEVLLEGQTDAITGYSTTGTTVATLAAERDARARLVSLLADQVIDALYLADLDL